MNTLIRASAGSGKTYALTTRYLRLLHAGASPESILATTFTRKAAGEILERVLKRLADAAADEKALADLRKALDAPDLAAIECRRLLAHLCRHLHRVSVSTLDSFFHRLCRAFQLELGLPPGITPVEAGGLADTLLRRDALRATLAEGDLETMRDILNRLNRGKASRSVVGTMDEVVSGLYELHRDAPAEAWQRLRVPPAPAAEALDAALAFLEGVVANPPTKQIGSAVAGDVAKARAEDWAGLLGGGLAAKVASGENTYYRRPIEEPVVAAYETLIEAARSALLGELKEQTEATYHLLDTFARHYDDLRLRRGLMLFSDAPRALAEVAGRYDPGDIAYRLDAAVDHLLLDEFQDTSPEQWAILRPFAQRCSAGRPPLSPPTLGGIGGAEQAALPPPTLGGIGGAPRSFFCVGDVKQAIYGWRGGSAEIFARMEGDLAGLAAENLDVSYRSSQVVLDAVNTVFSGIAGNPALDAYAAAGATWGKGYNAHRAHRNLPGYVELATSPAAPADDAAGDAGEEGGAVGHMEYVAGRVREVWESAPHTRIGILVRTNAAVHAMLDALRHEGVEASGEGAGRVDDDPAVEVILSAMTLADHPGHTAAAFHVAHSPLAPALGATPNLHEDLPGAADIARAIRQRILVEGYGRVVTDWARVLAEAGYLDRRNARRLMQLIDLADAFEAEAGLRPGDFVRFVRSSSIEDAATSRVRVMTIHRSKGLEFDVVFLPELHKRILGQEPLVLIDRPSPTEPIRAVYRYPDKARQTALPALAEVVEAHRAREVRESLCVLYVAMTRARRALHLVVPPLKQLKSGKPGSIGLCHAAILRQALVPEEYTEGFDGCETLYAQGDPRWVASVSSEEAAPREEAAYASLVLKPASGAPTRNCPRVTPSTLGSEARRVPAAALLGPPNPPMLGGLGGRGSWESREGARYGTRIHALFEQVAWSDEPAPDDETLLRTLRRALPDDGEGQRRRAIADFREMLAHPEVRAALARPKAAEVRLWRETPFSVLLPEGILEGRFDRVVVTRGADGLLAADLLDFKTDDLSSTTPDAAIESHRAQMQAYRQALERMLGIPAARVRTRLLFTSACRCCEAA